MSIKELPSMEHSFSLDTKGSDTGQHYQGSFTYKRPNLRTKSEIAKTASRLNEDLRNLDEDTALIHQILATLRHTLVKYPEWWASSDFGFELYDANVSLELYRECTKFENEWFSKVWSDTKQESKDEAKA